MNFSGFDRKCHIHNAGIAGHLIFNVNAFNYYTHPNLHMFYISMSMIDFTALHI